MPDKLSPLRFIEVTLKSEHRTPVQLQGFEYAEFQVSRLLLGSESDLLNSKRERASWSAKPFLRTQIKKITLFAQQVLWHENFFEGNMHFKSSNWVTIREIFLLEHLNGTRI